LLSREDRGDNIRGEKSQSNKARCIGRRDLLLTRDVLDRPTVRLEYSLGDLLNGVQAFEFSESISSPVKGLSGFAFAVPDLFVSPKNRGPDHWAPVMSRAILVSER